VIELTDSIEIARTPADTFAFVADLNNLPKWQSEVVQSTVLTPGPTRVGTRFTEKVKMGPSHTTAACEVTDFRSGSLMGFRATSPRVDYMSRLSVEDDGDGSRVVITGSAQMKGWWRLMEPLMRSEFKTGLRKELAALKAVMEAPATSRSSGT
jgi:hypothetical protein